VLWRSNVAWVRGACGGTGWSRNITGADRISAVALAAFCLALASEPVFDTRIRGEKFSAGWLVDVRQRCSCKLCPV